MSSVIIGETVSRIISSVTAKDEKSSGRENIERLEMAHIKMKVVLQISERWKINHVPLLQCGESLSTLLRSVITSCANASSVL